MRPLLSALLICLCHAACAADWLTVASDAQRRVELDRASILPSDAGSKVAWGRIVLSDEQAKTYGYRSVRALNRYDCRSHSFMIVKRVYLSDDERTMREDRIDATSPSAVKTGTIDDRFFNEVCKPASATDLRKVAKQAIEQMARAELEDKPSLRRANIRLAKEEVAEKPASEAKGSLSAAPGASSPRHSAEEAPALPRRVTREEIPPPAPLVVPPRARDPAIIRRSTPSRTNSVNPALAAAIAAARSSNTPHSAHDLHWSYEGENGPANWDKLDPQFATCARGTRQSPIDIRDGIKVDQEAIQFDYKPSMFRIVDNGHTIQITYGPGSRLSVMGRSYDLVQMHFHHPAEERIDGKSFDMVAHLVHRDSEGRLAVLAVLFEVGANNPLIQTLWNNLPLEKNEEYAPRVSIQIADLLPEKRAYFSYMGSLTTPPCSEGVLWLVLKQPVQLSAEQMGVFSRFYPNNARPIQPASGRVIKESR